MPENGIRVIFNEFKKLTEQQCALCESTEELTGEHKIKASLLRAEFGDRHTVIFGKNSPKILQSPKSKYAHFKSKICKQCNSQHTQVADKAFDRLHKRLKKLRIDGVPLTSEDNVPNFELSSVDELDVCRYFAKLLCCFLVETGGPRSKSISEFAISKTDKNPIFLTILEDYEYETKLEANSSLGLAEHGGLTFRFDNQKRLVKSIESSLSAGGIKYLFWVELSLMLSLELNVEHKDIIQKALDSIVESSR